MDTKSQYDKKTNHYILIIMNTKFKNKIIKLHNI